MQYESIINCLVQSVQRSMNKHESIKSCIFFLLRRMQKAAAFF